ncbi:response regulator [bacterium]|nr:response regulator [bacterium]
MDTMIRENRTDISEIPEKFYEELYSKADILYFRLDESFQVLSCNITVQDKLLYEKESLIGTSFLDFIPENCHTDVERALQTCLNKGYVKDTEVQILTLDKQIIDGQLNGLTYQNTDDDDRFLRLYIRDMTLFKHADLINQMLASIIQTLKSKDPKSNALYKNIASIFSCDGAGISLRLKSGESVISGFWSAVDSESDHGAKDFRRWHSQIWTLMIQKCQKAGAGQWTENGSFWTGYLKDTIEILHEQGEKNVFESLNPYESMALVSLDSLDSQQGYFIFLDRRKARWDEKLIKMLESISHYLVIASNTASLEQGLIPSTETEQVIHPWMNLPVIGIVVTQYGMIRHANPWIETLVGQPSDQLMGKSFKEIISPEHHHVIDQAEPKSNALGHFKSVGDIDLRNYQGKYKKAQCILTHIPMGDSICELWYLLERHEDLDMLSRMQQSKKLEALGMLAGGIVHDFDNLLSTIIGFTTLLKEEIDKKSSLYKDVLNISETADRAVLLTSRLLAYAHGKSYLVEHLNVNQLVSEVAGILSRTLDKNMVIRADLDKNLYSIQGDAGQIQQAILQVALNSMEAMPHGGSLVFQTRNMSLNEEDPRLKNECHPGHYVQIVISDTGLGMSTQIKDQIFEPQFSTKDPSPGRGLGLAMVRQIVEQKGGFVSVFSEIGKGTVFKIHLPSNTSTINQMAGRSEKASSKKKITVLVIDDDRLFRDSTKRLLVRYGYQVMNPESFREAMSIYKKFKQTIDLIILDLMGTGQDARKTVASILKLTPKAKILATCKAEDRKKITSDMTRNCSGLIQKPFQLSSLLKKIQTVLHE